MEIQKIETLLLQEMEDVKGGASGVCECTTGARQSSDPGGTCKCKEGAGQLAPDPGLQPEPTCICTTVGGAGQK